MFDGQLVAFMGVSLVIVVTPGPDMALVLRNAILADARLHTGRSSGPGSD